MKKKALATLSGYGGDRRETDPFLKRSNRALGRRLLWPSEGKSGPFNYVYDNVMLNWHIVQEYRLVGYSQGISARGFLPI